MRLEDDLHRAAITGVGAIFEVFYAVKIQVEVFWVVTPLSVAVRLATHGRKLPPPYLLLGLI
jgi:hypothetical protein